MKLSPVFSIVLRSFSAKNMIGICHKCDQKVSGEGNGCTAMDQLFHIKCFVCTHCGKSSFLFQTLRNYCLDIIIYYR